MRDSSNFVTGVTKTRSHKRLIINVTSQQEKQFALLWTLRPNDDVWGYFMAYFVKYILFQISLGVKSFIEIFCYPLLRSQKEHLKI